MSLLVCHPSLPPAQLLRRCQVIVATCAAAGDPVISEMGLKFTAVVVDEAAQVPEAHCLIPLTRGAQVGS